MPVLSSIGTMSGSSEHDPCVCCAESFLSSDGCRCGGPDSSIVFGPSLREVLQAACLLPFLSLHSLGFILSSAAPLRSAVLF